MAAVATSNAFTPSSPVTRGFFFSTMQSTKCCKLRFEGFLESRSGLHCFGFLLNGEVLRDVIQSHDGFATGYRECAGFVGCEPVGFDECGSAVFVSQHHLGVVFEFFDSHAAHGGVNRGRLLAVEEIHDVNVMDSCVFDDADVAYAFWPL